jgi:hypothetical protein
MIDDNESLGGCCCGCFIGFVICLLGSVAIIGFLIAVSKLGG